MQASRPPCLSATHRAAARRRTLAMMDEFELYKPRPCRGPALHRPAPALGARCPARRTTVADHCRAGATSAAKTADAQHRRCVHRHAGAAGPGRTQDRDAGSELAQSWHRPVGVRGRVLPEGDTALGVANNSRRHHHGDPTCSVLGRWRTSTCGTRRAYPACRRCVNFIGWLKMRSWASWRPSSTHCHHKAVKAVAGRMFARGA